MFIPEVETASPSREGSVSKRFYEIAGRCLSVEADAVWVGRFAEAFASGFHLAPCARPAANPAEDLHLTISTAPPPPLPVGLQEFTVPGGVCHADDQSYHLSVTGSRVDVGPPESRRVAVWLGPSHDARTKNALITVFAYALPATLRRLGLYDLHACGMVEPSTGRGFIFPGTSESGKTSLAIRLGVAGWRYMSDDLLTIFEGESGIEMRPLRRPFQTDAATLARLSLPRLEEALGVTIPNDPDKRKLDPTVLFPDQLATVASPRVLCFPSITDEMESRVEPLAQTEAMMRLVKMCPWASYDASAARAHLALLGRLVRQCRAYRLDAGRDIFDNPDEAGRLLAALA